MYRVFGFALAAIVMAAVASLAVAEDKVKVEAPSGAFVSSTAGKITIKETAGEKSYDLATSVKVTIHGKEGKVADLKAGDHISMTMTDGKVSAIVAAELKPKG